MRNRRKMDYKTKRIKKLQNEVKSLESENKVLVATNNSLNRIIEKNQSELENIKSQYDEIRIDYDAKINEMISSKNCYEEAMRSAKKLQSEYAKKVDILLKRLEKQK